MIACALIATALASAAPGATVSATGVCDAPLRLANRDYRGVTLDASAAHFPAGAVFTGIKGLAVVGGTWGRADIDIAAFHTISVTNAADFSLSAATVLGNGDNRGSGVLVVTSTRVTIARNTLPGHGSAAITVRSSSDALVVGNRITRAVADGINITDNQRVVVQGNRCSDFTPAIGAHPDCVQLRNLPDRPPQADVMLIGNVAVGRMQAFFGDCHRTTFIGNYAAISGYTHTVTCAAGAVGAVAIGNVLANTPDAPNGPGSLKGFAPDWVARNQLWDARIKGPAPLPVGVEP